MESLARMVIMIFAIFMIVGGLLGYRIANNYKKSKLIGTITGVILGYILLIVLFRIKSKVNMQNEYNSNQITNK